MMHIATPGLEIIKYYEGWSSSVYQCPAGRWTQGWGSTWDHRGNPITSNNSDIDEITGESYLRREISHVEKAIGQLVKAELTQNMFDSICSFCYNCGTGAFQRSTMKMKLNRGDYLGASDEFKRWCRSGGRILKGLVLRRVKEKELFLL